MYEISRPAFFIMPGGAFIKIAGPFFDGKGPGWDYSLAAQQVTAAACQMPPYITKTAV